MGVWPKIKGAVVLNLPRDIDTWKCMLQAYFKGNVCFVVPKVNVILRSMFFDEIIFQEKGLFFVLC